MFILTRILLAMLSETIPTFLQIHSVMNMYNAIPIRMTSETITVTTNNAVGKSHTNHVKREGGEMRGLE